MDEVTLRFPIDAYTRLRELVLAAAKWPATGENGVHAASQLLLMMQQQVEQQQAGQVEDKRPNGTAAVAPDGPAH